MVLEIQALNLYICLIFERPDSSSVNKAIGLETVPVYCWLMLESLIETI
jgi:hypothetical protein